MSDDNLEVRLYSPAEIDALLYPPDAPPNPASSLHCDTCQRPARHRQLNPMAPRRWFCMRCLRLGRVTWRPNEPEWNKRERLRKAGQARAKLREHTP